MAAMNISLPDSMRLFVEEQMESGGFASASEYLQGLIRWEQRRKAEERLESLLFEGEESGEPQEMTPETWAEIRRAFEERVANRCKPAE